MESKPDALVSPGSPPDREGMLLNGKQLSLAHAFGVFPAQFRDAVIFLGDDSFLFCVGCHIAIFDLVKGAVQFVSRSPQSKIITAMSKSPNGKFLAVGEKGTDSIEIQILSLQRKPEDHASGSDEAFRTLHPNNRRADITCLAFTSDSKFLVSLSGGPEFTLTYWRWESEKLVASQDIKVAVTRIQINPRNTCQISVSGLSYLRLWEYSTNDQAVKEFDAFLTLKQEKEEDFVDHCWIQGTFFCAATVDGRAYLFEEGELKTKIDIQKAIADAQEAGKGRDPPRHGRPHSTDDGKPPVPVVELVTLTSWGRGFCVGGSHGYLGVFQVDSKANVECIGSFWLAGHRPVICNMSAGSDDSYMVVLAYGDKDRGDELDLGGMSEAGQKIRRASIRGGASKEKIAAQKQAGVKKANHAWHLCTFPIGQADLASTWRDQEAFTPVYPLGFHQDRIVTMDAAMGRRCLASCGDDCSLRVWTYPPGGKDQSPSNLQLQREAFSAELVFHFSEYDRPNALSIHPLGFQVAVILQDRLRVFHIAKEMLKPFFELPLKSPTDVCYSHSGDLLAVTSGSSVILLDCWRSTLIHMFSGHLSVINQVSFSDDDQLLMSCGADGAIYGWDISIAAKTRVFEHVSKGTCYSCIAHDMRSELIAALNDTGHLRVITKENGGQLIAELPHKASTDKVFYTCLKLAVPLNALFVGSAQGSVRVFPWPLSEGDMTANKNIINPFVEFPIHAHTVSYLALSNDYQFLFSGCEGGSLMVCNIETVKDGLSVPQTAAELNHKYITYRHGTDNQEGVKKKREDEKKMAELQKKLDGVGQGMSSSGLSLDEFVLVPKAYLNDKLQDIKELEERMENLKNDTEYTLVQKEQEMEEKLKMVETERTRERRTAGEKYDTIFEKLTKAHQMHDETLTQLNASFERKMKEQDDLYEERLAKEYDKQNRLLNEVQNLKQKHREDMDEQQKSYEDQLSNMRGMQEKAMHEWRAEYDKVCSLLKTDGLKFEEALRQQELEYEQEISEMTHQKRMALQTESEKSTTALKDAVSMKQTINLLQGQLEQKADDLTNAIREREDLRKKLETATDHFQKAQQQLRERDTVIKVKDEAASKLREQQKHLESFRFVLFHKVRALEEERDPLEDQVNSLRDNVKDMYNEFVKEFRQKQKLEHRLNDKAARAHALQNENLDLRSKNVMVKKDLHRLFNDLQEVLSTVGYEKLVKAVQDLIAKYTPKIEGKEKIRKDQDEEEKNTMLSGSEGLGVAEEMVRQRDLLLKKSRAIAEANVHVNTERAHDFRRMTSENSQLISEMNQLRAEKKSFSRRVKELETRLMQAERQGLLNRASSAPDLDPEKRGSQRGGNMAEAARRTVPGGAANTPYLRRKEVDESEVYRRNRQQGLNMLPPVAAREGDSQLRKKPQRRGSQNSIQEQRFRDVIGNVDADDRSMEQQGFHTSKLREQVGAGGGSGGNARPLPLVREESGAGAFSEDDGSFAETRIQQP